MKFPIYLHIGLHKLIIKNMAKIEIGRREFLKKLGIASAVVSGTSLASCSSGNKSEQKWSVEGTGGEPTGKMTYRLFHYGEVGFFYVS